MSDSEQIVLLSCLGKWGKIWQRRYYGRTYFDWEDVRNEGFLYLMEHVPHPRHLDVACKFAVLDVLRRWCGKTDSYRHLAENKMVSTHAHAWLITGMDRGPAEVDLEDFLETFIPTLTPKNQEVLTCIRKEDTIPEIAVKMGVTEDMVRKRLRYIGEQLKQELRKG